MIYEDERRAPAERLLFVLHLGDFIYEVVWYPEDSPGGVQRGRRLRDIVRYPNGEKMGDFHCRRRSPTIARRIKAISPIPICRTRARAFPFVPVWDNHEFSWQAFQSQQVFNGEVRPAQTMKVVANQAWFEYQPARVVKPGDPTLDRFTPPEVSNAPLTRFDERGARARAQQSHRHPLAAHPSRVALRQERGAHPHRQPLVHVAADERRGLRLQGLPLHVPGRGRRHPRRRPRREQRQSARDDPLRRQRRAEPDEE